MSDTRFELAARKGHPSLTDVVACAGIGLGIALQAFAGHPTSTDVVARTSTYSTAVAEEIIILPPGTEYDGLRVNHNGVVKVAALVLPEDEPNGGRLRIRKNGVTYAVYLVEPEKSTLPVRVKCTDQVWEFKEKI